MGGAFDPIHIGHVRALIELSEQLPYDKLFFMPYGISPTSKYLYVNPNARRSMIELAVQGHRQLFVEDDEINQAGPAYTYATLARLRARYGPRHHLSFVLGDDSYASISSWKNWRSLLNYANLVVINRVGNQPNAKVAAMEKDKLTERADFMALTHGAILKICLPVLTLSSTQLRAKLAAGQSLMHLLPPKVLAFIQEQGLYAAKRDTPLAK